MEMWVLRGNDGDFVSQFLLPTGPKTAKLLAPEEREFLATRQEELNANARENAPKANQFFREHFCRPVCPTQTSMYIPSLHGNVVSSGSV